MSLELPASSNFSQSYIDILTRNNIQSVASISLLNNDIALKVGLGVHTVDDLSNLSRLQVFQEIVFVDGVFNELF